MNENSKKFLLNIRRNFFFKVREFCWTVHSFFPNVIPSPYRNSDFDDQSDAKLNPTTRVLPSDNLRVTCMWVAELYGPSEIDALYVGMRKFGWDTAELGVSDHDPISWIRNQRLYGWCGNFNIGTVRRNEEKSAFNPRNYYAAIPDSFKSLDVSVYQITKSLTCLMVGFVLNDESSRCYEREINLDRRTYARKRRGQNGYNIYNVINIKKYAVRQVRRKLRSEARGWVSENFPGLFARNKTDDQFPSMELILTDSNRAFPEIKDVNDAPSWLRFLNLDYARELWISKSISGLNFSLDQLDDELRFHVIATFSRENTKHLKGNLQRLISDDGILSYELGTHLKAMFVHESARSLLKEIRKTLSQYNEKIRFVGEGLKGKKTLFKNLKWMEYFFSESISMRAAAKDLHDASKNPFYFSELSGGNFECRDYWDNVSALSDVLKADTMRLSAEVIADEAATRELFEQLASVMSTRENINAQIKMERLTWGTIILSCISIVIAWSSWKTDIFDWWTGVCNWINSL